MNAKALAMVVAVALALPAHAQDVPFIEAPSVPNKLAPCQPGDVVLSPDAAVAAAKRLTSAEAKVAVYEKHPPLPAWAVVLLVVGGVAIGGAGVAIVYTTAKTP